MVNKITLIGNVGDTPKSAIVGDKQKAELRLATTRHWTANGERKEATEWHTVIVWDKSAANLLAMVGKGDKLYVEGRLQYRSWEKDGVKRTASEIVATDWQQLTPRAKTEQAAPAPKKIDSRFTEDLDDEIPF